MSEEEQTELELEEKEEDTENFDDLEQVRPEFKSPNTSEVINNPLILHLKHYEHYRDTRRLEERELIFSIKKMKIDLSKKINCIPYKTTKDQLIEELIRTLERQLWLREGILKEAESFIKRAVEINHEFFKRDLTPDEKVEMRQFKLKETAIEDKAKEYFKKLDEFLKDPEQDEAVAFVKKYVYEKAWKSCKYERNYLSGLISACRASVPRLLTNNPEMANKVKELLQQVYQIFLNFYPKP